jgi:CheY-like chemotaxis protein
VRVYTTLRVGARPSVPWCVLVVDDDSDLRDVLSATLVNAGHLVEQAGDGPEALQRLAAGEFDVVLLDVNLPSMNGLDVLAQIRGLLHPPLVIVMTGDETSEPLLEAVRLQAYRFLRKPFPLRMVVEAIDDAMATAPRAGLPIQVVSARPEWLEIIAPCALEMADRLQSFIMHLEADLPAPVRESVAQAFRELLTNAIEWGGRLDPARKVRISCVRAKRVRIYRIADPGDGFNIEQLQHAAISNPVHAPLQHAIERQKQGLRPGGLGLMMTRSLVDELIYNEARNEVIFIKYLD